jgi:aminoglycoside phosphotransferase (APT) family kinase protein
MISLPTAAEPTLTSLHHVLIDCLGGSIADLAALPTATSDTRLLAAQWTHADGTTPILIRFFHSQRALEAARMEAQALRDLGRSGFPVPELFALVEDAALVGAPFLVVERLPGAPLTGVALAEPARIPFWLEQAANLMLRLHSVQWAEGFDWLQPPLAALDFADRQVKWWGRKASAEGLAEAGRGFAWLRANMYRARTAEALVLVHRDLHADNLLAFEDRLSGVLDWAELTIADPAVDLAWSRLLISTHAHGSPAYGDLLVAAYLRRNSRVGETLPFWEVFSACKRLTTLALRARESGVADQRAQAAVGEFLSARLTEED